MGGWDTSEGWVTTVSITSDRQGGGWGGCGEVDVDGTVCQSFQSQTAAGYVCTCNTSLCNSIDKAGLSV